MTKTLANATHTVSNVALRKRTLGWGCRNIGHLLVETHSSPEAQIAFVEKTLDQGYEMACYRQLRANFGLARRIALAFEDKVLPPLCCARRKSQPQLIDAPSVG